MANTWDDHLEDRRARQKGTWNPGGVPGVYRATSFVSHDRGRPAAPHRALRLDPGDAVAHRALDDVDRRPGT